MQSSNWMGLNPSVKVYKPHGSENCCNSYFTLHQTRWDWRNCSERFECWNFSWFVPSRQETLCSWTGSAEVVGLIKNRSVVLCVLVQQKWLVCLRTDKLLFSSWIYWGSVQRALACWWLSRRWCWGQGSAGDRWDNQSCGSLSPASGENIWTFPRWSHVWWLCGLH